MGWIKNSSVARRAGEILATLYWPAEQNAEKRNYHVFSTSENVFCTGIFSKIDLKHNSKCKFRGGGLVCQNKTYKSKKKLKDE